MQPNTLKPYQPAVARLLNNRQPRSILDAPCGSGWLKKLLAFDCEIDGLDLFAARPDSYSNFRQANLDLGLPGNLDEHEAIVCCEGIEHFGNPELFFDSARKNLKPGGMLIVTTPNTWYPEARLQYFLRGFFPGFPCLIGKIERGTHMHIMPWSFPHLYLYLTLAGFSEITLHDIANEQKPKHAYEWLLGLPQAAYCRSKAKKAVSDDVCQFWMQTGSRQSVYGRRLVVSAISA